MPSWKCLTRAVVSAPLLLLAGCGLVVVDADLVEPGEPLSSAAVVHVSFSQGSGFLVDRAERLVMTSSHLVGKHKEVEVVFPGTENGKLTLKRDYYTNPAQKIKGKVIGSSPEHDLAVVQLESVPESARELKFAAASPQLNEHTKFVGDASRSSCIWGANTGTVRSVGESKIVYKDGQRVATRLFEIDTENGGVGRYTQGAPVLNDAGDVVGVIAGGGGEAPQLTAVDVGSARQFLAVAYRYLATTAFNARDYKRSLEFCDKALAVNPGDALAYNERGAALSYLERYDDASASYSQAIKLNPKLARAYRNRGGVALVKGDYKQAVEDCTEAIELDPNYAQAYRTRCEAYTKLKKTKEAKADEKQIAALTAVTWKSAEAFPTKWFAPVPQYVPPSSGCRT